MEPKPMLHTGEFAKLCGVNKRTLHYYDQQGIFSPDHVDANGYRCYSARQLYPFIMIRLLRQMGLDLAEIQDYMSHRSPARLEKLLEEQEAWLDGELRRLQYMKEIVMNQRAVLAVAHRIHCDTVEVEEWPSANLICSRPVRNLIQTGDNSAVERIIMEHMRYMMEHELTTGQVFGAMVRTEDCLAPDGNPGLFAQFFTVTTKSLCHVPDDLCAVRSSGRYLVTYFKGDYMKTEPAYARLRYWLQEHPEWQPGDYSYEESILEELSTANPREYITRVAIQLHAGTLQQRHDKNDNDKEDKVSKRGDI